MSQTPAPDSTPVPSPRRPLWRHPLGLALLPVAVAALALRLLISWQTSPRALVDRMESQLDARVSIEASDLSLFHFPARLELHGVRLAARDAIADKGEKLSARAPIEHPLFTAESMLLEGSPWALLTRKIDITDLNIAGATADLDIRKNGSMNVTQLFKQPAIVNGKPNPKYKLRHAVRAPAATAMTATEAAGENPTVEEMPMAARIKHLVISGDRIQALVKGNGTRMDGSRLRLEVSDLDVDPANLAAHNTGKVRLSGAVRVLNPEKGLDYATLNLIADGTVRPFDPETRELKPLVRAKLTFLAPSEISLLPSMDKMNKKLEALKKVGITLGTKLGNSISFADQTSVDVEYRAGEIKTLGPLAARARKLDVKLDAGASLHTGANDHKFRVTLLADDELSAHLLEQVRNKANILPAGKSRDAFLAELTASFFPGGRFQPVCLSTGDIGSPDIELENPLPDMGKFLKGVLQDLGLDPEAQKDLQESTGELLKGLLKGK